MKAIIQGHYQYFSVKYRHHPAIVVRSQSEELAAKGAFDRIAWRYGWTNREDFIKTSVVREKRL